MMLPQRQAIDEAKSLDALTKFPIENFHFYSDDYDLTRLFPSNCDVQDFDRGAQTFLRSPSQRAIVDKSRMRLFSDYCWNEHLRKPFAQEGRCSSGLERSRSLWHVAFRPFFRPGACMLRAAARLGRLAPREMQGRLVCEPRVRSCISVWRHMA